MRLPKRTKNIRNQTGSATVEAAVVVPLLMIVFLSILSVVRIVSVYGRIQHALNRVAAELSQYSYIYAVSGLKERHDEFLKHTEKAWEELNSQVEILADFYNAIREISGELASFGKESDNIGENIANLVSAISNAKVSSEELYKKISPILDNPVDEIKLIGFALSELLLDKSKNEVFCAIAKTMLVNNLSSDLKLDPDKLGKVLFLKSGIERLDFSSSAFFYDNQTIDIIVEYTVKPGFLLIPEIRLRNRACMLSWMWGSGREVKTVSDNTNTSLWNFDMDKNLTMQHLARGKEIERLFASELKRELGEHAEITPANFKTIDLIEYAHGGKDGKLIMIFSLNPFLPTYRNKSAVTGVIRQNLNKLGAFQSYSTGDYIIDISLLSGNYKRIAYIVIPENKPLPEPYVEAFEECRKTASKMGIQLYQVQKYGEFDYGEKGE